MGALEQLIQNEVDKRLAKSTLISSVPCRVVAVLGNEVYTVELVTSKSRFDLVNYSGSPLSVNESVQVYYRGDTLTSQSGYIGASLTKGGGGSKDVYVIGTKSVGELSNTAKTISEIAVKALEDTTVTLSFNANIYDGTFILKFYINAEQYDYTVKGQSILGAYNNCQVVLPISLVAGETSIKIKATGNGTIDDIKAFVWGQGITNGTVTVKEKEGYPPLSYTSFDNRLLDWNITGVVGGVGKLGKNYLKPKTTAIPNGAAGTYLSGLTNGYQDALNGVTINSGNADIIYCLIRRSDDSNLTAANVGTLMIVEGDTIPSAYDADVDLYKKDILQGTVVNHNFQGSDSSIIIGESQMIYCTEDEYGRTNYYGWQAPEDVNGRCKSYSMRVKKNTNYSLRVFNSSYSNLQMGINALTEPGTITPQFQSLVNQKSIPGNETFVANTEQWEGLAYSHYATKEWRANLPIDIRPMQYEFCEYFADLKAGTYKLMVDIWGNNNMGSDWIGFSAYRGCFEDNWDFEQRNLYEWFALVKDDNTPVISKTRLFDASMDNYENRRSKTSPFPTYFHKEIEFTLAEDTKVGLMHKAYYVSESFAYPPYFRFYIVDADTTVYDFTTTDCSPTNMSGRSAWEKYSVTLPITIASGDQSQTITIDLNGSLLYENDSVSMTSTSISLPSYVGLNTITVDSENQPWVYIKYTGL